MSTNDAKVVSTQPLGPMADFICLRKDTNDARWIKLLKIDYEDARGKPRTWETAERRTRPKGGDIDGVGIVAILEKPTGPEIVLQKQFRPPIDKVTIEVPAGLVDEGETAEQAAIRELREETGYVAEVAETTPMMFNDPGFCNTNLRMVHVTIDMSLPENQDPKPQLEDDEFIEVFTAPLKDLWAECKRLEAEGYAIDARVGTLAEGIEIAKQFKL
ncbi:MutT/nudix family protein [Apiospora hydei]|uniref:MutT/nudix family protein n=1 Tax=Apiospora hydei TaxID=1337664 RepID=A0ABR1VUN1_9PEZI